MLAMSHFVNLSQFSTYFRINDKKAREIFPFIPSRPKSVILRHCRRIDIVFRKISIPRFLGMTKNILGMTKNLLGVTKHPRVTRLSVALNSLYFSTVNVNHRCNNLNTKRINFCHVIHVSCVFSFPPPLIKP